MTNTVYGPYVPHTWITGDAANATRFNNLESQASDALHGFNPDLIGAGFVYSGVTCTKDGTVANQLDIAAGRAYVVLSDGTVGLIVVGADNTHTTSTINTTYFLDLNPDGTWSWGTSHSAVTNHLTICSVTTDASGNILAVTDTRVTTPVLFPNAVGKPSFPTLGWGLQHGVYAQLSSFTDANGAAATMLSQQAGAATYLQFLTWNGTAAKSPLGLGSQALVGSYEGTILNDNGTLSKVGGQATVGNFGVSTVIAATKQQNVVNTTNTTICSATVPAGTTAWVRVAMSFVIGAANTNNGTITTLINYTDPVLGAISTNFAQYFGASSIGPNTVLTKGVTIRGMDLCIQVTASSTVTLQYQNSAAGTISDTVSASIEILA